VGWEQNPLTPKNEVSAMPQNVIVFQPDMSFGELIERFGAGVQGEAADDALVERKGLCYPMRRQQNWRAAVDPC
jgi:hypothetical protein